MTIYKIKVQDIPYNSIDIDGKDLSYSADFDLDIKNYIFHNMQINFDGTEVYDEVIQALDKASMELLRALKLINKYIS